MPFPAGFNQYKVTATWTSPPADGSNTVTYVFRCMAISAADCLTKAQSAFGRFTSIGSGVSFNTPTIGW